MKIRRLLKKDAQQMLVWMHDKRVTEFLSPRFKDYTLNDAIDFIESSRKNNNCIHLAVCDDTNNYKGTVSLKRIDKNCKSAEFAISLCFDAHGKGYSYYGADFIFKKAFNELGLENIFLCVSPRNLKAIEFYKKIGFLQCEKPYPFCDYYSDADFLKWYCLKRQDFMSPFARIDGLSIVDIKTIKTSTNGQLSFFESMKDVPFKIERVYYIYDVLFGNVRGFHAHKNLKQLIFCPHGKILLTFDDGNLKRSMVLDDPTKGLLITKPIWRTMRWLDDNSLLVVAASQHYDENDYIRCYDDFKDYLRRDL